MRFSMGEKDFDKVATNIVGYSNEERVKQQRAKGPDDMDVDSLAPQEYSQEQMDDYIKELETYYCSAEPEVGWLGKGKNKGAGRWRVGKGEGT